MQHHESHDREDVAKTSSDRAFGLTFAVVFLIVAAYLWYVASGAAVWWAVAAAVAAVLAWLAPSLLNPLNRLWAKFGLLLFKIINPIVIGFLFFGVVTPYGVLARWLGKTSLRPGFDRAAASYWIERNPPGPPPASMRNQY